MQICSVTRFALINPIVRIVFKNYNNEPQYQPSTPLKSKTYSSQTKNNSNEHHNYHNAMCFSNYPLTNSDWFIMLFDPVVIDRSYCFGIGFSTVTRKPLYKYI